MLIRARGVISIAKRTYEYAEPLALLHCSCSSQLPRQSNLAHIFLLTRMSGLQTLKAAILVVSDTASQDASTDRVLPALKDCFAAATSAQWEVQLTEIVPDEVSAIKDFVERWSDHDDAVHLIVTSGGTGFAVKDKTPEVC